MTKPTRNPVTNVGFAQAASLLVLLPFLLGADPPPAPPVSEFAPAGVLLEQTEYFSKRLASTLSDGDAYGEASQGRVRKEASTLAVLLLALGLHDEPNALKDSAPELVPLARRLADSAEQYQAAKTAYDALTEALAAKKPAEGDPLTWTKLVSQSQLMKQVTTLNSEIRRGTRRESSFPRYAEKVAGSAATMAVIAQASLVDTHEVKDPAQLDQWYQMAAEWRDAAGAAGKAARENQFEATTEATGRILKSCDECHAVFRKDES